MLEKAMSRLKQSGDEAILAEASQQEMDYYKKNKNTEKYTKLASLYVPQYMWNNAMALNAVCWTYFMRVDDKPKLAEAEMWIAQSVKLDEQIL